MTEDQGKQDQEKLEFTPEGETLGYISSDQATVLAMRVARDAPGAYGRRFRNVPMAFEITEGTETEDHYIVTLSFRPEGPFTGTPGREQFFIEKEGTVAVRQVLGVPTSGGIRRFLLSPITVGVAVVAAAAVIGVALATGGDGDAETPRAAVPPTSTSVPVPLPGPPANTTIPVAAVNPALTPTPTFRATATAATAEPFFGGLSRGGRIAGTVTDSDTGLPISGVIIRAENLEFDGLSSNSNTDVSGRYELTGVALGRYRVRPTEDSQGHILELYNGSLNWADADIVTVRGTELIEGIDFALKIGGQISGKVTDAETGLPISRIVLEAGPVRWDWISRATTDANGNYTLRGLLDGLIRVRLSEMESDYGAQRETLSLLEAEAVSGFNFALVLGITISGRVTDVDTGIPIANLLINAENVLGEDAPSSRVNTDSDGRYTIRGVASGSYRIRPCCPGLKYIREFYDGKLTQNDAKIITVSGTGAVEGIDFAVKRGATISGRVRDGQTGLGIPSMRIHAGVASWPYISDTISDGQGEYVLRGVPNGSIVIEVEGQGCLKQQKLVTVRDGEDLTGVDF